MSQPLPPDPPAFAAGKCGLPALPSIVRRVLLACCHVPKAPGPIAACDPGPLLIPPPGPVQSWICRTHSGGIPPIHGTRLGHAPVRIMAMADAAGGAVDLVDSGEDMDVQNVAPGHVEGNVYILVITINGRPVTCTEFCLGSASIGDGSLGGGA